MDKITNLEGLTAEISDKLYNSINLLEILEDIQECGRKEGYIITTLQENINKAFEDIETCRHLISVPD